MEYMDLIKFILIAGMAYAGLAMISVHSAKMLALSLCAGTSAVRVNAGPACSEQVLAETLVRSSKIVPARFTGRLSRCLLDQAIKCIDKNSYDPVPRKKRGK